MQSREAITCFGGGRGQSTTLEAIALYHPNRKLINSVCTSADDGSDSGVKRKIGEELGIPVLPPGDMRRCMQPLASDKSRLWLPDFAEYRFPREGVPFEGLTFNEVCAMAGPKHQPDFATCAETLNLLEYPFTPEWGVVDASCLGNVFLTVSQILYRGQEAIDVARRVAGIEGGLAPVSLVPGHIQAIYGLKDHSSAQIKTSGESELDKIGEHPEYHPDMHPLNMDYLHRLPLNPRVEEFINCSKQLVFSMGSWYTSLMANLMVDDCIGAISRAQTKNTLVVNLFCSKGEANHLKAASDFVADFVRRTHETIPLHRIILNNSEVMARLHPSIRKSYEAEGKQPVIGDEIERRRILGMFPNADVRVLPLASKVKGSRWVGHDMYMLGKNIVE